MSDCVNKPPSKMSVVALAARKGSGGQAPPPAAGAASERTVVVTAYDVTFARLAEQAGVDVVLVGDSLDMVIQGYAATLPVTVGEVVYYTPAVARGVHRARLVADMPFMSYQASIEDGLRAARRLLKDGGAEACPIPAPPGPAYRRAAREIAGDRDRVIGDVDDAPTDQKLQHPGAGTLDDIGDGGIR